MNLNYLMLVIPILLLLNGCSNEDDYNKIYSNYGCVDCGGNIGEVCSPEPDNINCLDRDLAPMMEVCSWNYFEIVYVDDILGDNCYAIKQKEIDRYELRRLKESFDYAGWSYSQIEDKIYEDENYNCRDINTNGLFYCLRDNSTCLRIKGNICEVVTIED